MPEPTVGPVNRNASAENGFYLIDLLKFSENDSDIRSCWDMSKTDNKVIVHGNYWPERQLTKNFDLVAKIFKILTKYKRFF